MQNARRGQVLDMGFLCRTYYVVQSGFRIFDQGRIVPTIYIFFFPSQLENSLHVSFNGVLPVTHIRNAYSRREYLNTYVYNTVVKYPTIDVSDSGQNFSDLECPAFRGVTVFGTLSIDFCRIGGLYSIAHSQVYPSNCII